MSWPIVQGYGVGIPKATVSVNVPFATWVTCFAGRVGSSMPCTYVTAGRVGRAGDRAERRTGRWAADLPDRAERPGVGQAERGVRDPLEPGQRLHRRLLDGRAERAAARPRRTGCGRAVVLPRPRRGQGRPGCAGAAGARRCRRAAVRRAGRDPAGPGRHRGGRDRRRRRHHRDAAGPCRAQLPDHRRAAARVAVRQAGLAAAAAQRGRSGAAAVREGLAGRGLRRRRDRPGVRRSATRCGRGSTWSASSCTPTSSRRAGSRAGRTPCGTAGRPPVSCCWVPVWC